MDENVDDLKDVTPDLVLPSVKDLRDAFLVLRTTLKLKSAFKNFYDAF